MTGGRSPRDVIPNVSDGLGTHLVHFANMDALPPILRSSAPPLQSQLAFVYLFRLVRSKDDGSVTDDGTIDQRFVCQHYQKWHCAQEQGLIFNILIN